MTSAASCCRRSCARRWASGREIPWRSIQTRATSSCASMRRAVRFAGVWTESGISTMCRCALSARTTCRCCTARQRGETANEGVRRSARQGEGAPLHHVGHRGRHRLRVLYRRHRAGGVGVPPYLLGPRRRMRRPEVVYMSPAELAMRRRNDRWAAHGRARVASSNSRCSRAGFSQRSAISLQ